MIVKTSKGYVVKSDSGNRTLSKPYPTKQQAQRRLAQVEYWKNKK